MLGTIEQGLIYGIMALGVYITFKILDFPDLSVDGTFTLGAAVAASALTSNVNSYIACLLAFIMGNIGGGLTGFLHVKLKITNILSGILVMVGLYSINLRIMGRANVPLFQNKSIFTAPLPKLAIILMFAICLKIILDWFLKTKYGFLIKATGSNERMVIALGKDTGKIKIVALMLANGLVALSGAILAQYQQFSDIGMGTGTVVMGLASIILGETLFKRISFINSTTTALIGAVLYRGSITIALRLGLNPNDLKLITAIIVVITLSASNTWKFSFSKLFRRGGEDVEGKKPMEILSQKYT